MDTRSTLYSQISEFEGVIDSFNNIHACLGNGEIEIHDEVVAIKEKLVVSMRKDIPKNVTDVDKLAFCGCKRLEKVHFENPDMEED